MDHVRDAFNRFATDYDRYREHIIPDMRQLYAAAVWAMETSSPQPEVLDLGAGTGLISVFLLEKYPKARLTLMDIASEMLDRARQRFADRPGTRFIVSDYRHADLGGPYDIVCSALSIHHLETEDKRQLFHRVHAALRPGGMFVNADQADGETAYFRKRHLDYWHHHITRGPMSQEQHAEIQKRMKLDRNEKLSDQLAWLREAGFRDVDVVYRNRTFVVTVGRKAD
jgi:tRNA (cmo5U34)-methyltransferase